MSYLRRTLFILLALTAWLLPAVPVVFAQVDAGLQAVGSATTLTATDPRVIAARIINITLGFLGIIMLGLILYAGFLWMTSGGDTDKVDRAQKMIRNAIIGAIIILSSWGIATFILSRLGGVVGGGGGQQSSSCQGAGCNSLIGGGGVSGFQLVSVTPVGDNVIRNARIRFLFSQEVEPSSASSSVYVTRADTQARIDGPLVVDGTLVIFTPDASCPEPNGTLRCFDGDTSFIAHVGGSLQSKTRSGALSETIACGGFAPACDWPFKTGNVIDTQAPTVQITGPYNGQSVSVNSVVQVSTQATDDSSVSLIRTLVDQKLLGTAGPLSPTSSQQFSATFPWDTNGVALGTHVLSAKAFDVDDHESTSQPVSVIIRPEWCFNGVKDEDETGLDCGGPSCGSCSGAACSQSAQCASGVCKDGVCVEQPVIVSFSPGDGAIGTFVTITGANFGTDPGTVLFANNKVAVAPAACSAAGVTTWTPNYVTVAVPPGTQTGPITLKNSKSGLSDATNDPTRHPVLPDYVVNNTLRPGLCAAVPDHGQVNDVMKLVGGGLGSASDQVLFSDRIVSSFQSWADGAVALNVPVYSPGNYAVRARVKEIDSNTVPFRIDAPPEQQDPMLHVIDPGQGPVGEYITLIGRFLGERPGIVYFKDAVTGEQGVADVRFPAACPVNFWHDQNIIVKVPATIGSLGNTPVVAGKTYQVFIVRQGDNKPSNSLLFPVNTSAPKPGLCALLPTVGPAGTAVELVGERFGDRADLVTFQGDGERRVNVKVDQSNWRSGSVSTTVPQAAVSGLTRVQVGVLSSNGINFEVQNCNTNASLCSQGEICCKNGQCSVGGKCSVPPNKAQFGWFVSTGKIPTNPEVIEECPSPPNGKAPSPSPWNHTTRKGPVCVNAEIAIRFTTKLDPATVKAQNFIIKKCIGPGEVPCDQKEPNDVAGTWTRYDVDDQSDYVVFQPQGDVWEAASTYEVIVRADVKSLAGIPMLEKESCGAGNGYCFGFSTRNDPNPCELGYVSVNPDPFRATELNQQVTYRANGLSADDICLQLNVSSLDWRWDTKDRNGIADGRASVPQVNPKPPGKNVAIATTLSQAPEQNPVLVNASYVSPKKSVRASGQLIIAPPPPTVEAFGPNCDAACSNAVLWARFNVPVVKPTPLQVILRRCVNENCVAFDQTINLDPSQLTLAASTGTAGLFQQNVYLRVEPTQIVNGPNGKPQIISALAPGRFYKATLSRTITSVSGLSLVNLNDPAGFAWTFRVKQDPGSRCVPERVEVIPSEKIEQLVGARQSFVAQPLSVPDRCNATGQPLMNDVDYDWLSSDVSVSKLINGQGDGLIQTWLRRPAYCTDRCLNVGASGVAGRVASCGNSVIETTNARYCRRNGAACKPNEQGCTSPFGDRCLVLSPGAMAGEECDDGAGNGENASCSNRCLWNAVVGGSCGNGTVDRGEQCDPGKACTTGPIIGRACSADVDCNGGVCSVTTRNGCSDACQALGAISVQSTTCGNDDVAAGETCDDSNTTDGDGCSTQCLHEGSSMVSAQCGNNRLEAGESCESCPGGVLLPDPQNPRATVCIPIPAPKIWTDYCKANSCLSVGASAVCEKGDRLSCCGNSTIDPGEECDEGMGRNKAGSGCSPRCLKEGSSMSYTTPSICGDGDVGAGEQCDAVVANNASYVSPVQLGEITATRDPDAGGKMTAQIEATYDPGAQNEKKGTAVHGLQCGFKTEAACTQIDPTAGLTNGGCCALRPVLTAIYPAANAINVCRNVLVTATFNVAMNPATLKQGFILAAEADAKGVCPAGTQPFVPDKIVVRGWRGWVATAWSSVLTFFGGQPAEAATWCVGSVRGKITTGEVLVNQVTTTRMFFNLTNPLAAQTNYRAIFLGDRNLADALKEGIQSARGVVAEATVQVDNDNGRLSWSFKTGNEVCTAQVITMEDLNPKSSFLFTKEQESHAFRATANAVQDGKVVPLSSMPGVYEWTWQKWVSSNKKSLTVQSGLANDSVSEAVVKAENKNGSSLIFAGIRISADTVHTVSTVGLVLSTSKNATVLLCERPWPDTLHYPGAKAPFSDSANSDSFLAVAPQLAKDGPFYNFSTLYCMDAGETGSDGDLPSINIQPVAPNSSDAARGLQRQYLFTFNEGALKSDGIGIRVLSNPLHLSPSSWYLSRGFTGSPQSTTVDGYEAIQDGTTIYVASANVSDDTNGPVSSTIYLISRNEGAKPETQAIYKQLVENWTFNVNFTQDSQNICVDAKGAQVLKSNDVVTCTADWECAGVGPGLHCASFKAKLQRDTKRIADLQTFNTLLNKNKQDGKYPVLGSGSYLPTLTTSRWPSWQAALGSALGGNSLPQDPVNRFLTCGTCTKAKTACTADADCPVGDTCVGNPVQGGQGAYDPVSCWSATDRVYQCPRLDAQTPSHVYQYRAVDAGSRYELSVELEGPADTRYQPRLMTEVARCSHNNQLCQDNLDCAGGTCNAIGGRWVYGGVCDGLNKYDANNVCGNGARGPGELCEIGESALQPCKLQNGSDGTKVQSCSDCKKFIDGPSTTCVANSLCGNGRVDTKRCVVQAGDPGLRYGRSCTVDVDCVDPRDAALKIPPTMVCQAVANPEVCDEGAVNGTYGHCRVDCQGIGAVCGDGQLSLGEKCDNGFPGVQGRSDNGNYCGLNCKINTSCALDCRGPAPYCGDGVTQPPFEACEPGSLQRTEKAICNGGFRNQQPCDTNADCLGGDIGGDNIPNGACGKGSNNQNLPYELCQQTRRCSNDKTKICSVGAELQDCCVVNGKQDPVCAEQVVAKQVSCIAYPTYHTRSCNAAGVQNQCRWPTQWSACQTASHCGDGHVDPNEACDDGNRDDNDVCTNQCKKNICSDGILNVGVEECDNGPGKNDGICLGADYGSTCVGCSATCKMTASSGGYCGDRKRQTPSPEQCDVEDGLSFCSNKPDKSCFNHGDCLIGNVQGVCKPVTCRQLGFDYGKNDHYLCTQYSLSCVKNASQEVVVPDPLSDPALIQRMEQCGGDVSGLCGLGVLNQYCVQLNSEVYVAKSNGENDVEGWLLATCKTPPKVAPNQQKSTISCSQQCGYQGCKRCQEDPGTGSVSGRVFDAIYSNQPIPGARVTLYLRGIKVDQVFTTENGTFTFSKINTRPECSTYKIIVDYYKDNLCTGTNNRPNPGCGGQPWPQGLAGADESVNGGYWPYESNTFNVSNFLDVGLQNANGKIYLAPRVGLDETLVVATWNDELPVDRFIDAHLVVPPAMSYRMQGNPPYTKCVNEKDCLRTVFYGSPGDKDLSKVPHGFLACFHPDGSESCGAFTVAPETMKYKRGNWAVSGNFEFYLVDWNPNNGLPSYKFFDSVSLVVRVITQDKLYVVKPKNTPPLCKQGQASSGKYWRVFTQDAATGAITLSGGAGQSGLYCTGDAVSGEKLPAPLKDVGGG